MLEGRSRTGVRLRSRQRLIQWGLVAACVAASLSGCATGVNAPSTQEDEVGGEPDAAPPLPTGGKAGDGGRASQTTSRAAGEGGRAPPPRPPSRPAAELATAGRLRRPRPAWRERAGAR